MEFAMKNWDGLEWMLFAVVVLCSAAAVCLAVAAYQDYQLTKWVKANCEPTEEIRDRRYTAHIMVGKVMVPQQRTAHERRWACPGEISHWIHR